MGLVKFGGGVSAISGKIAGQVFGRNKAGSYIRNWAKPVNPVTPSQAAVRAIFQTQSAFWAAIGSSDRDAWNAQAKLIERINKLGETYVPSGRQYFMELNNSLEQAGLSQIATPPVSPLPPAAVVGDVLTATQASGVLTVLSFVWATPTAGAPEVLVIEGAPPSADTKTNVNVQYRQVAVVASDGSPANILAAYIALFGSAVATGDLIRLRVTTLDGATGYRSASILTSDTV
jgi:hypothetical protein